MYKTNIPGLTIRLANQEDAGTILGFIHTLAIYEKMEEQVVATEEILTRSLFEKNQAEVLIAEFEGKPVGMALFFQNFSTFLGKANLYLEDLIVNEEERGKGYGKALFSALGKIAVERDCQRLDWACLNWNEPSIRFYKSLGAVVLEEWMTFRATGESLLALSKM